MSRSDRRTQRLVAKSLVMVLGASIQTLVSAPRWSLAQTASVAYEYSVIAKTPLPINLGTTSVTLTELGRQPSASDFGEVAFVGHHDGGEGIFAKVGTDAVRSINPQYSQNSSRTFGDIAQLTNRHKIIARDRVSGSPAAFRIRMWEADPGFTGNPSPPNIETVIAYGGTGFGGIKPDFDAVVNPTMSANGHMAFVGIDGGQNHLAWGSTRPFARSEPLAGPLHPVVNENGSVLVKLGNKPSDPIRLYAPGLAGFEDIACPSGCRHPGFSGLGSRPGMSEDGELIVFTGTLEAPPPGLAAGPGVFMSIGTPAGSQLLRVATLGAGAPEDTRASVNSTHRVPPDRAATVAYIGANASGNEELATTRVAMTFDGAGNVVTAEAGAPNVLATIGASAGGLGPISDLDMGKGLSNRDYGDVVFWAKSGESHAVVRARSKCAFQDYTDRVKGTYVNQYAAGSALDLPKSTAGTPGGNSCGPSSFAMAINQHKRDRGNTGELLDLLDTYANVMTELPVDLINNLYQPGNAHAYALALGYSGAKLSKATTLADLLKFIDDHLDQRVPVVVSTAFGFAAWGQFGGGHVVEFVARTATGDYIVNDPAGDWFSRRQSHYGASSCGRTAVYERDVVREYLVWRDGSGNPVSEGGGVVPLEQAKPRVALALPDSPDADPPVVLVRARFTGATPDYHVLVEDPTGKRTGWLDDGSLIEEIAKSEGYRMPELQSDPESPSGSPLEADTESVVVTLPPPGLRVTVTATGGEVAFDVEAVSFDGSGRLGSKRATGVVSGGQPLEVDVGLSPANRPPDCSNVKADVETIWPPNHKLQVVTLTGGSDPDGDPVTLTVTGVSQDEPVAGFGDGDTAPDAQIGGAPNQVLLRAERIGEGDGRVYRVSYTVTDSSGLTCLGSVLVSVPHDGRAGKLAVDSGQMYDSLAPAR